METKEALLLFLRYVVLVVLGFFFEVFYFVFTPLTVYPAFWGVSLFFDNATLLTGNLFFFGGVYAQIIGACVAGSAYYLLLILNLTTPMSLAQRVKSISFLFVSFLILNVLRIIVFALLLADGAQYFDEAHLFTWYIGSTVLVVLIWFIGVWLFKIEKTPVYSDMKNIFSDVIS